MALAKAYFRKGQKQKSRQLFQRALAGPISAEEHECANAYLAAIDLRMRAAQQRRAPDHRGDRAKFPESGAFRVRRVTKTIPGATDPAVRPDKDFTYTSSLRIDRDLYSDADASSRTLAFAELYAKGDAGTAHNPDEHTFSMSAGLRYSSSGATAQIQPKFSQRYSGTQHVSKRYGLTAEARQKIYVQSALFASASAFRSDHKTAGNK